jgi:hypothetical protein
VDTNKRNISELVRIALKARNPLQYILSADLCREIAIDQNEYHAIDTALRRHALGDKVAKNQPPKQYYAIRFGLPEGSVEQDIFLSLPGIDHEYLVRDDTKTPEVENYILGLQRFYGEETIDYWVRSTQYHSVALARQVMKAAKDRDGNCCRICQAIMANNLCPHLAPFSGKPVTACHIISRRTIFWATLWQVHCKFKDTINDKGYAQGIFSDQAVIEFQLELKKDKYHSTSEYIVALCVAHNRQMLKILREAV